MAKGKGGGTVGTVEALVTPVLEQLGMRLCAAGVRPLQKVQAAQQGALD